MVNYFNSTTFPDEVLPTYTSTWVTVSGNQTNGAPYMGRKAQRAMVVQSLNAAIATNTAIRDEDNFFNLLATPNYPELQPGMITLNNDRGQRHRYHYYHPKCECSSLSRSDTWPS